MRPRDDRRLTRTTAPCRGRPRAPAALMWRGYEAALGLYQTLCAMEWEARGYRNTMQYPYLPDWSRNPAYRHAEHMAESALTATPPPWLGREDVHSSHRARLLYKDPEWYGRYGGTEAPRDDETGYVWPV